MAPRRSRRRPEVGLVRSTEAAYTRKKYLEASKNPNFTPYMERKARTPEKAHPATMMTRETAIAPGSMNLKREDAGGLFTSRASFVSGTAKDKRRAEAETAAPSRNIDRKPPVFTNLIPTKGLKAADKICPKL